MYNYKKWKCGRIIADILQVGASTVTSVAEEEHTHDMEDIIINTSLRLRPQIEFARIQGTMKPTMVDRGVLQAFSLPVYNSDDEEIFFNHSVPRRWDGASNITVGLMASIDTTNDNKKFSLQLDWANIRTGDVLGTSTTAATCEVSTGASAAQYTSYDVAFTVDYDIAGVGNEIQANDVLAMRLRRIAATETEITGEVMVYGFYVQYMRDKIGAPVT